MKQSTTKDSSGKTHIRETTDDGRHSRLYETGVFGEKDRCVEVADHYEDGTTRAFEYDGSVLGELLDGGRGREK